ncbi:MAG: C40 family peptidase [Gammaproteobacteria bacterium]
MKKFAERHSNRFFALLVLPLAALLFSGCSGTPKYTLAPSDQSALSPVIPYALSLKGAPYRYGEASPQKGFDCSGFVMHVYQRYGVYLPRTVEQMARSLPPVQDNNLRSGDLVFFNTNGRQHSHVGILVKDDKFVHAPSSRTGKVLVSSLNNAYWRHRLSGARRPGPVWPSPYARLGQNGQALHHP